MLKVEGSNPGFAVYFSRNRLQSLDKNESTRSELDCVESRSLDFWRQGRTTAIDPTLESFVLASSGSCVSDSPAGVPQNLFEEQDCLDTFEERDCLRRRRNLGQLKWTTRGTENPEKICSSIYHLLL